MDHTAQDIADKLRDKAMAFNTHQASDQPTIWDNEMAFILGMHGAALYTGGYPMVGGALAAAGGIMYYKYYFPSA